MKECETVYSSRESHHCSPHSQSIYLVYICPRKCYAYAQMPRYPEHVNRNEQQKGATLSTHLIWAIDKYRVSDVVFLFIPPNKRRPTQAKYTGCGMCASFT